MYPLKKENPSGICLECPESRIFPLSNGSFKTYAEWRLQDTGRHYVTILACNRLFDVFKDRVSQQSVLLKREKLQFRMLCDVCEMFIGCEETTVM